MTPKIVAYFLTLDEEEYISIPLKSIINHVDKILILDGGSTDKTIDIAKSICGDKLFYKIKKQKDGKFGEDWNQSQRRNYILDEHTFINTAMNLLDEFRYSPKKVRLVGVRLSGLKSGKGQLSLNSFFNKNKCLEVLS